MTGSIVGLVVALALVSVGASGRRALAGARIVTTRDRVRALVPAGRWTERRSPAASLVRSAPDPHRGERPALAPHPGARLAGDSHRGARPAPDPHRGARPAVHRRRLVHDLPGALEDVARSLRSGTSLRVALAEASNAGVGPARTELAAVVADAERGIGLRDALDAWAQRRPVPEVRLAVAALGLGLEAGITSARTVDGVAATLRERLAVAGEVATQAAQARLSALVIAVLPIVFTTWACLTDGRIADFLLATPAGWACLGAGVLLNVVGALWMARIMRSVA